MSNYYDRWGRLHHKPCVNGEPSSNNSWLYSAYLNKLNPNNNLRKDLSNCYRQCLQRSEITGELYLIRSPYKDLPPMSRDEVLGMAGLRLLKPKHVKGWSFSPLPIPKFNLVKLVQQLWELRPIYGRVDGVSERLPRYELTWKHRNYFWENNLDQLYRFAFSVPLTDRAFLLESWGETDTVRYAFYKAIAKIDSMFGEDSGIRWLKYDKSLEAMRKEFPEGHPLKGDKDVG